MKYHEEAVCVCGATSARVRGEFMTTSLQNSY